MWYNRAVSILVFVLAAAFAASQSQAQTGGYPVNEDSDYDGIPDWWIWKYFGNYNENGTNLDSSGVNTLLSDYLSGLDPNVIQFTIAVANNYVNTSWPSLQLNVTAGTPSYYAVLVDSTNFATTNWTTCSSYNVLANLGTNEGWHGIWIGLRGMPADAQETWEWKRLKLDLTPPLLVITSPTNGTATVPMIELTGYSPESLDSISYDLTNAVGLMTNQQVLVLNRYYDPTTGEFTTNTFQGFDIPLTNGVNTFTLHATDLAGNVTTTNFSFILDYSSKTNPPPFTLTWPTNGTVISGGNFTWDGFVSDPTVVVTAQITSTNGSTNTVNGLVERNGKFWVENLPLSSGTNVLTLTVTDAAGNTGVTNICVVQSDLVLTMDPVTPDTQLWQPTVNLTGTISDATYAVWANGVKGHNNGDGTWSASNVPTTTGGTATFTITAYSPDETQPDGSHGN